MNHDTELDASNTNAEVNSGVSLDTTVGVLSPLLIHCNLPMQSVDTLKWRRTNGSRTLSVTAGDFQNDDSTVESFIPYGKYARHILFWICSEAALTQSRHLTIASLRGFLMSLGITYGSRERRQITRQLQAILTATISFSQVDTVDGAKRERNSGFRTADEYELFFGSVEPDGQGSLLPSSITLSQKFYDSLIASGVPILREAWVALSHMSKSPLVLDVYTWLCARLFTLNAPSRISWDQLRAQFGTSTTQERNFRGDFIDALTTVEKVYPHLRWREEGKGERSGFRGIVLLPPVGPLPRFTTPPAGGGATHLTRGL